jgi:hypothetical protein
LKGRQTTLAWQVHASNGKPIGNIGRSAAKVDRHTAPAAFAQADGSFVVIH